MNKKLVVAGLAVTIFALAVIVSARPKYEIGEKSVTIANPTVVDTRYHFMPTGPPYLSLSICVIGIGSAITGVVAVVANSITFRVVHNYIGPIAHGTGYIRSKIIKTVKQVVRRAARMTFNFNVPKNLHLAG